MNETSDYSQIEKWKTVVEEYLRENRKIDDYFCEEFFGKAAQARFLSKTCDDLHDAMIMNGLSGIDCTELDFSRLSPQNFMKITFDTRTQFPENVKQAFLGILEKSKQFGYGLEELLQEEKLSGEGINVAVIDENFDSSTFDGDDVKIVSHDEYSSDDHYHGKTVTSLLASKSCGVAKGANVYFYEKTSEEYRQKRSMYKQMVSERKMSEEEFNKWKNKSGNDELARSFEKIIAHNKKCKNDSDKITVLSGSWSIPSIEFEKWQKALRDSGCELVCQNNFIRNFTEISGTDVILEMTEEERTAFSEPMRKRMENTQLEDLVKIPINRTYHQFGTTEEFKYQASYSNSWGIPQIAGLLALYKAKDKSLTFEEFCDLCKETSLEGGTINPKGLYEKMEKRFEKVMDNNDEAR